MALAWQDAQTLLAVIEQSSFSAAAITLSVGQPTISRRIRDLEQRLGQRLFIRGKHGAQATPAALKLLPAAQQMARWASEFERAAKQLDQKPMGRVTIAAPPGIAVAQLTAFAAKLRIEHPGISLQVLAGIKHIDLIRGEADFAIRSQLPVEPGLVALHKVETQMQVVASESYLLKLQQQKLRAPYQLSDIDWIGWAKPFEHVMPNPVLKRLIENFNPVFSSDDYLVQKAAARQGVGAMIIGLFPGAEGLEEGLSLLPVDMKLPKSELFLVAAKSMRHVERVNSVIKMLLESYGFE